MEKANEEEINLKETETSNKITQVDKLGNKKHPEQQEGEVFLGNFTTKSGPKIEPFYSNGRMILPGRRVGFDRIEYNTKRIGLIAYDVNGNTVKDLFPVFVGKEEYEENRINTEKELNELHKEIEKSEKLKKLNNMKNQHPEQLDGEKFLGSFDYVGFKGVGYKSKRIGSVAYDIYGNSYKGYRPVFVHQEEYEKLQTLYKTNFAELGIEIFN